MIALPAMIMVFVTLSLGLGAAVAQHRIQQLASDHARVLSFGGDPALLPGVPESASATTRYLEDLVCIDYQHSYREGAWRLAPLVLVASACALAPPLS